MSLLSVQERPRPEFAAMAPAMEENPVTGVKEPYFPEKARLSRMLTGSMVIVIMVRHSVQLLPKRASHVRQVCQSVTLIHNISIPLEGVH